MKVRSNDSRKTDELDLDIEALKDLTPSSALADQVRGGVTSRVARANYCECGSM